MTYITGVKNTINPKKNYVCKRGQRQKEIKKNNYVVK